jgi:hypothetical protein
VRDAAGLIWIKAAADPCDEPSRQSGQGGRLEMPFESFAVTVGVVAAFTLFSIVLAWAYHATNRK